MPLRFPKDMMTFFDMVFESNARWRKWRARKRWKQVRQAVVGHALTWWWREQTQKSICAPGGVGRKRDLDAYLGDPFMWTLEYPQYGLCDQF